MATKTTAAFEEAYSNLNPGQKQAVDTIDGPVMVLAGPGTGKTQTLTVRIGKILQDTQLDPWNILCLTFTEAAAAQMRERLASLIGSPAYSVRISTFHSFCNSVIQEHPEIFAITPNLQPLSDVERVQFVQEALDSLVGTSPLKPFGNPYLYLKDCVQHIQALKQEDITPKDFRDVLKRIEAFTKAVRSAVDDFCAIKPGDRTDAACDHIFAELSKAAQEHALPQPLQERLREIETAFTEARDTAEDKRAAGKARTKFKSDIKRFVDRLANHVPRQKELVKVYERYQKYLAERGRYDFEDMIINVVNAFREHGDLLATYQEQFQYILVDEFQDTNGAQNEVVDLLGNYDEQPNIFVVGDDKQSIYRFQGASLANMLSFYERYKKHVQIVSLSENYRSQETVLTTASSLIAYNKQLLAKSISGLSNELEAKASFESQPLHELVTEFPDQEMVAVGQRIQALMENGETPNEIAILVRYNRDAQAAAATLRQLKIPVVLAAGENVLEQSVVKLWLSVWRYVSDGVRHDHLLSDIIQAPWWNIDALDALRAVHAAGRSRRTLTESLADKTFLAGAGVQDSEAIVYMMDRIARWRSLTSQLTVTGLLTTMLEESGWLTYTTSTTEGLMHLEYLRTLVDHAGRTESRDKNFTLARFVELLDLHTLHDVALLAPAHRLAKQAVTVMTAHKAKGQEFTHVFIPYFVDGRWGGGRPPYTLPLPHGLVRYDLVAEGENDEDERRLLYVAITRARQSVTISRSHTAENGRPAVPSRFEQEIPASALIMEEQTESAEEAVTRLANVQLVAPVYPRTPLQVWLAELLEHYVLSVTHLNNYLEDPQLFYRRNLLQVPSVRTSYQAMGTAVHNALNAFFVEFRETGKLPAREYLLENLGRYLIRESLTKQEYTDALAVGQTYLGGYYDTYHNSFVAKTIGEYDFRQHNVRVGDIPITGKIDKVELLNGKQVNVVDYKTGNPSRGLLRLKPGGEYHRQLVFYKLLGDNSEQFPYDIISGEIDFVRPNTSGKFIKKKVEITDKDLKDLTQTIQRVWQEIMDLKFLEVGKSELVSAKG